jgi:hypothetical protein
LNDQLDRLAFVRMGDPDPGERNVLALQLRHLSHVAHFHRWRIGIGHALHDPIAVGRGGSLRLVRGRWLKCWSGRGRDRRLLLRQRPRRRRLLRQGAAGTGNQHGGETGHDPFIQISHEVMRG